MKSFTVLFISVFFLNTFSQDYKTQFSHPDMNELTMQKYEKDTSAEAVVLFDVASSNFIRSGAGGFELVFERTTRMKILSEAGSEYAKIEIPYYWNNEIFEKVRDIKAYTYNVENGYVKTTSFDAEQVYDEKVSDNWKVKKFALPNVKAGSVIEYTYKIYSNYLFNLQDWSFQWRIPVVYSEYVTKMIPFYTYAYILQGKDKIDVFESYQENALQERYGPITFNRMIYRFGLKDIPAFNDESLITSINDYIIKIDFQLSKVIQTDGSSMDYISTWDALCRELLKDQDFGKYLDAAEGKGKSITEEINLEGKTSTEKVESIVNYVKRTYKWNGSYSYSPSKNLREFTEDKTGNTANMNLYLTGLLRSAGIEAYPVLLSTRGHGKIRDDYPFLHFFNSVVVLVNADSTLFLTDATDPLCQYNEIPPECINDKGLIVQKKSEQWVTLVSNSISEIKYDMKLEFASDMDSLKGYFKLSSTDYDASKYRKNYYFSYSDFKKSLGQNGLEIKDSLEVKNLIEIEKPFEIYFNAGYPIDEVDNKVFVLPFLNEPIDENPLKQPKRTYPVDFIYVKSRVFHSVITIPQGYKLSRLPEPVNTNTLNYFFYYDIKTIDDNKIEISSKYTLKKAVYDAKFYTLLKIFFGDVVKKLNEPIVLEKI